MTLWDVIYHFYDIMREKEYNAIGHHKRILWKRFTAKQFVMPSVTWLLSNNLSPYKYNVSIE